jgi:ornithine cyclodeaminase
VTDERVRMLVLSRRDVEAMLDLDRLRQAMAEAMADVSARRVSMPNRVAAVVEDRDGFLAAMPAFLPSSEALTTKLVSLFPRNRDRPTHQAVIVCFDPETGTPIALLDGTAITAARTAAGSALSTDLLARDDARTLAIIGTGAQARSHAIAVSRVRPFERIVVAGRDRARTKAFVDDLRAASGSVEAAASLEDAVRDADVVCAATHAGRPVVRWGWLRPGSHVTSVGFNTAGSGEVDGETVRRASLFVESRDAALAPPPSGAIELASVDAATVREIGDVVARSASGRTSPDEVTLYKSVGVAAQDAAAAALVLADATRRGVGREVEL